MTTPREDMLDSSARARRGDASDDELKRLRSALGASSTLQVAHQVGTDFDAALWVKPTDAELIDGIIAGALAQGTSADQRSSKVRRRFAIWLAAAAALFMSAGASAWWRAAGQPPASRQASPGPVGSSSAGQATPRPGPRPAASAAPARLAASSAATSATFESPRRAPSAPSAAELFAKANQARGGGRNAEAIQLYRALQRSHPASAETLTSHIALGRLLLAQGERAAALSEFERHLQAGGALAEEALLWRARTLGQLGRRQDEQTAFRTLLERYPNTVYEREAKSRLESGAAAPTR